GIDVAAEKTPTAKATALLEKSIDVVRQAQVLSNPDAVITTGTVTASKMLSDYARSIEGLSTGDGARYLNFVWEIPASNPNWEPFQLSPTAIQEYDGFQTILRWERGTGSLVTSDQARVQGNGAWGKKGVLIGQMRVLKVSLTCGFKHDKMTAALIPNDQRDL